MSETITISDVRINEPISDEIFTLAGMDLADKTSIIRDGVPGTPIWNKATGSVDSPKPQDEAPPPPPTPIDPPPSNAKYWLIGICIACLVAAFAVLFIRRRRANS